VSDPLSELRSRFERDFFSCLRKTSLKSAPALLQEAVYYTLAGKNKRLRPVLALEGARLTGLNEPTALRLAAALECLHTYSLVHDDLPAMDDDDLRRGQPSCHRKYGEWVAILVGDLLQSLSFELLAQSGAPARAVRYYARAIGAQGMVSGQFLDMDANHASTLRLHRLKTGKLIEASVILPFLIQENKIRLAVLRWARGLGLLFQITDDLLDATENSATLGKTAGKDAAQNKKTIVAALGLKTATRRSAELAAALENSAKQIFRESQLFASLPGFLLNRRS
jgi:geranylgeranyl pyrophosphate synthase